MELRTSLGIGWVGRRGGAGVGGGKRGGRGGSEGFELVHSPGGEEPKGRDVQCVWMDPVLFRFRISFSSE